MSSTNIFEAASRAKLKIASAVGVLAVDQLWDLPLIGSPKGADLNTIAVAIDKELDTLGAKTFVEEAKPNPHKRQLQLALDIVKHIIAVKQDEAKRQKARAERAAERQKLVEALANQQDKKLANMSEEEILRKLRSIDDEADEAA